MSRLWIIVNYLFTKTNAIQLFQTVNFIRNGTLENSGFGRESFFEIIEPLLTMDAALPNGGTQSERSAGEPPVPIRVCRCAYAPL